MHFKAHSWIGFPFLPESVYLACLVLPRPSITPTQSAPGAASEVLST